MKNEITINKRDKINLLVSGILILFGIILVIYPLFGELSPNRLLYILLSIYGVVKLIEYVKSRLAGDKEDLFTGIICILVALSGIKFLNNDTSLVLSITLVSWIGLLAIIKLIKLDYYHDRGNIMIYTNLVTFSLFLLLGLLTCLNLYFDHTIQTLILGYFFIINGLLNLLEDAVRISFDYNKKKK
ncbi:MAG: hypothetical protein PHD03_02485 [Bacilli bacterium]|nr:hypothetical protein [Bacilli bacterium]MDD4406483.1 hypothetical protein [Bacilli bacterium]